MPPEQRAHHFSARDQATEDSTRFAHPGAKDLHQPHEGNEPLAPRAGKKRRQTRGQTGETELGTLRPLPGGRLLDWWANGEGVFGAWQMQGLIAGASLGLTLAPALEMQAGTAGQAWATPSSAFRGPRSFQSFGQGSPGWLWTSLSLPGHLGSVSPTNGTRPVGLQPLVDTLGVELVVAGEDPEQLPCLEVAEADDTQRLL